MKVIAKTLPVKLMDDKDWENNKHFWEQVNNRELLELLVNWTYWNIMHHHCKGFLHLKGWSTAVIYFTTSQTATG